MYAWVYQRDLTNQLRRIVGIERVGITGSIGFSSSLNLLYLQCKACKTAMRV